LHGLDGPVGPLVIAKADEDLIEHDVVGDRGAVCGAELRGKAASQGAAPLDELGDASSAELPQGGPRGEAAGPA